MNKFELQNKIDIIGLNRVSLLDENGAPTPFNSLYQKGKVAIIFLRHFGCIACRSHVTQVLAEFKTNKIQNRVVFIGNGAPHMIKVLKEDLEINDKVEFYTDPSLESFDLCGLNRGLSYLVNFKSANAFKSLRQKGHKNDMNILNKDNGSQTQMGGIVVIEPPGKVKFHFSSEYLGDVPRESLNDLSEEPRP